MDKGSHVREMTNVYNERGPFRCCLATQHGGTRVGFPEAILIETAVLFGRENQAFLASARRPSTVGC